MPKLAVRRPGAPGNFGNGIAPHQPSGCCMRLKRIAARQAAIEAATAAGQTPPLPLPSPDK